MDQALSLFESIVRKASQFTEAPTQALNSAHPFEQRNIHPKLPERCKELFDNGHFSESTFEATKYLDFVVQRISGNEDYGKSLMMTVFGGEKPRVALSPLITKSHLSEQEGYKFLFSGAMCAIRNPKGHDFNVNDNIDTCLEHLSLISLLLRRLESSGYKV